MGKHEQISVTGEGAVQAVPDLMRLSAGVEVRRAEAGEAFTAVRAAAARLTKALIDAGVAAEDLRTNELSLGPEYVTYPKVAGYRAAQGIEAVVRVLDSADKVIDAAVAVSEDVRLNGVTFEVSDPAGALARAREQAFADAAAKAAQYATLAGRPLAGVLSVSDDVLGGPQPVLHAAMAMEARSTVSPGQQTLSVSVRVVYAIE